MMDIINKPLGWILKLCSNIVGGNYLFAILIFAIIVEVILLPFGIKQQKNSIKQARLRPKEMAIRKKYAGRDDKPTQQRMAQEIQELYQKEGYNPMSGCLPLLIQFPLLIALYNIVIDPLKYICGLGTDAINAIANHLGAETTRGTMGLLTQIKQHDYSYFKAFEGLGFTKEVYDSVPNLNIFGVLDLSVSPSSCMNLDAIKTVSGWLILSVPVITFLAYFFSMKMTRKFLYQPMNDAQQAQTGCSNKMMDIMMPLLSVFISFGVPAALGVYWIFKSFLGVAKQAVLYFVMPLPKFTDEDYKAAEKEIGAIIEKSSSAKKSGRVVRSLHHIDDEDFEDTAEAAKKRKEALEAQQKADEEAKSKKKGVLPKAPIKKDDRATENNEEDNSDEKQ